MTDAPLSLAIARDGHGCVSHVDVRARPPRRKWRDGPPTAEMIAAFEDFYGVAIGRLRHSQVAAMLAYRSVGIACAERLLAEQSPGVRQLFARIIAAFVANRRSIARDVRRHDRLHSGSECGRYDITDAYGGDLIATFVKQTCAVLSEGGIVVDMLKFTSVGNDTNHDRARSGY